MNINITIAVQAVNFFIAYILFRFILLKPAYNAIQEDRSTKQSLEHLIADEKCLIEEKRQIIIDQWSDSALFFKKHLPLLIHRAWLFKGIAPKMKIKPIEKSELEEITQQLSDTIIQTIGLVDDKR